jgi:hypothetical protein
LVWAFIESVLGLEAVLEHLDAERAGDRDGAGAGLHDLLGPVPGDPRRLLIEPHLAAAGAAAERALAAAGHLDEAAAGAADELALGVVQSVVAPVET